MGLREYHRKRRFDRTPEPKGGAPKGKRARGGRFVIQKHAASRLHWDFRLEMDGVLRSWAVPKGPSDDPGEKRLAVHVEDHPLEYGSFEGVIPKGEYGGGTVMLWDRGRYSTVGDPVEDYRLGKLKLHLEGEKLRGIWNLVRMGGRAGGDGKNWLLFREDDGSARRGWDPLGKLQESVKSGRTMGEIAEARGRVWRSNRKRGPDGSPVESGRRRIVEAARRARASGRRSPAGVEFEPPGGARRAGLPRTIEPELATLVDEAPDGTGWLHEIKYDGFRMLCAVRGGRAHIRSRNGKDWTARFPTLAAATAALPAREALLDGEIVALRADGISSFQDLQNALGQGREAELVYFAFDLLHLDGWDLRPVPLRERKELLRRLVDAAGPGTLRYSDHVEGRGPEFLRNACGLGLEGIVSKRADAPHRSGRHRTWLKAKCANRQEFVIGGFTDATHDKEGFGALLVGYREGRGARRALRFAGKVGTGFTAASMRDLHGKLRKLERRDPPFADPPRGASARGVHWVEPKLVAEVAFTEWTGEGNLRHPSFQGLREDKKADQVVREIPRELPGRPEPGRKSRRAPSRGKRESHAAEAPAARDPGHESVAGVRLTHPERILYPGQGIRKIDLARYYEAVAERMLPHVEGRPLTLVRCPEGRGAECFYQKHASHSLPGSIRRVRIAEKSGTGDYLYLEDAAGLVALVQMGVLEIHVWGSHRSALERPDRVIFDLDPDAALAWGAVVAAARHVRARLEELGLASFLKTTGGKGLHVVLPLERRHEWGEVKSFSKSFAESLVREAPDRYTSKLSKAKREGKVFIDWLRNQRGATAIAAWSSRAREGAPVAMPVDWSELGPDLRPDAWTVETAPRRLRVPRPDPWAEMTRVRQRLTASMRREIEQ